MAQQTTPTTEESPRAVAGLPPAARPVTSAENPIALGQAVFRLASPSCNACHSISPGVTMAGPSLAGVATRAAQVVASPEYKGQAKDAAGYIREAIVSPSAHILPGAMFSANGVSFMPNTYGEQLSQEQVDQLVAYLGSLI